MDYMSVQNGIQMNFLQFINAHLQTYKKYSGQMGQVGHPCYDWARLVSILFCNYSATSCLDS